MVHSTGANLHFTNAQQAQAWKISCVRKLLLFLLGVGMMILVETLSLSDNPFKNFTRPIPSGNAPWRPIQQKIAFMFLVKNTVTLEPLWRAFFAYADPSTEYSIYVHSTPKRSLNKKSFFAQYQLTNRVETQWGNHSLTVAERLLLREALKDQSNHFFVLLSESCIPLYGFAKIQQILLAATKSSINACPGKVERTNPVRYPKGLEGVVPRSLWRKSSQWVALTRKHAALLAWEERAASVFAAECGGWCKTCNRQCISDEHYFPTVLASEGAAMETDCAGRMTSADWVQLQNSPRTYHAHHISTDFIAKIRKCHGAKLEICHLFARKFHHDALNALLEIQSFLFQQRKDGYMQHTTLGHQDRKEQAKELSQSRRKHRIISKKTNITRNILWSRSA